MYGFKPRVVVDEHEQILTASVGWLVKGGVVDMPRGVSGGAGSAIVEAALSEGRRRVGGKGW
eukprot:1603569-Pleurochrysis_carterae.AAC.1